MRKLARHFLAICLMSVPAGFAEGQPQAPGPSPGAQPFPPADRGDEPRNPARKIIAQCIVADPSGTPLNIRDKPYGRIVGQLYNGTMVAFTDTTYDRDNRPWVHVGAGWVFRDYLNCD